MRTRPVLSTLCILLLAFQAFGQQASPPNANPPIQNLKNTVGFVRVVYQKDGATWESKGTSFLVGIEDKRLGEDKGFVYLVTNRHVVEPEGSGQHLRVLNTYLRLNLRSPEAGDEALEFPLPIYGSLHWYFPADEADDLAVLPFTPNPQRFNFKLVPMSLFATKDVVAANQIAEGDKVVFTGFFYQFPGLKKLEPIVREGIMAMMPDEKMVTTLNKPGNLYLADVHVFGGNSGSPVFVDIGGIRGVGTLRVSPQNYLLLGIVSGYMYEDADFKLTVATTLGL